jgi:acetyl-CoA carboxylase biotin carboxylase subunit
MFSKILIANRGEIACRIIKSCRFLGIRSAAIYSEADRDSLHVKLADEAYLIGPPEPEQSYLNTEKIIEVTRECDADAIHPGYGFLAERADFARACSQAGIKFIGPSSDAMKKLENKVKAKEIVKRAGIRVIPGSKAVDLREAKSIAKEISYPILMKAVYGGGGRGMRIARNEEELSKAFKVAEIEARGAFGRPEIYLEKLLSRPRHVEFQILADEHGNVVHLGERECSVQRRYQKLLEETPSPALDEILRKEMGEAAIKVAKATGYTNAGTIEFLLDEDRKFYFLEVNKRIQVEHLITELVTGIDLVEQQLRIASGARLGISRVKNRGWAINCRINCEDPSKNFMPSPGMVKNYRVPKASWIRIDSYLYQGYQIPYHYDSLIAKVAVWGRSREEAIERMKQALQSYKIGGIPTTIPFHLEILGDGDFLSGNYNTNLIQRRKESKEVALISASLAAGLLPPYLKRREERKSRWVLLGRKEQMKRLTKGW